jgi:CBS domain-containing protein
MKTDQILTKSPEVISPDARICEAARMMRDHDFGMLPVCDGERLVGSITDRDLAIRAVAEGCDALSTRVRDIMTPEVFYCFEDSDVEEAARMMEEKKIRRLPVLDRNKKLVGIVSLGDLAVRSKNASLTEEVLECVSEPAGIRH